MGMKARVSSSARKASSTSVRGPRRKRSAQEPVDISLLDMSLTDASGVRELRDQLGGSGRRSGDDSLHEFADPSLVVRLQSEAQREEFDLPKKRRSTTEAEAAAAEEAVGLFDMPTPRGEPIPEDGSLFGRVKSRLKRSRR